LNSRKILVVTKVLEAYPQLDSALNARGFDVVRAESGRVILDSTLLEQPGLVLLTNDDGGNDGNEICRRIRTESSSRIIMVSRLPSTNNLEAVEALDAGADDFVALPTGMEELVARVRASMRRIPEILSYQDPDGLEINFATRRISRDGQLLRLTPKEFDLLRLLVGSGGKVVSYRKILHALWGCNEGREAERLRVLISQLRGKIERNPSRPVRVVTHPGVGYCFVGLGRQPRVSATPEWQDNLLPGQGDNA
jgi:two-component system KDP operon response regulator KdpE